MITQMYIQLKINGDVKLDYISEDSKSDQDLQSSNGYLKAEWRSPSLGLLEWFSTMKPQWNLKYQNIIFSDVLYYPTNYLRSRNGN